MLHNEQCKEIVHCCVHRGYSASTAYFVALATASTQTRKSYILVRLKLNEFYYGQV